MADEITAAVFMRFVKGVKDRKRANGTFNDDVSGTDYIENTQTLSTSEEALDKGEITTPGWFWGRNNSSASGEIISIRQATSAANMLSIPPGCEVCFKFSSNTTAPFVVAATGTPELEYLLVEA